MTIISSNQYPQLIYNRGQKRHQHIVIETALYYSYNPGCSNSGLPPVINESVTDRSHRSEYDRLVSIGQQKLRDAIEAELKNKGKDTTHVVPISGGLDSRVILAGLLSHPEIEKNQVRTVTFGTPGTLDFDIGQQVAKEAGVQNTAIDLTNDSFDWSVEALESYAQTRKSPIRIFEGYVNWSVSQHVEPNSIIWSGFMGDPTTGAHQPKNPTEDWNLACERFAEWNCVSSDLIGEYNPTEVLPSEPYLPKEQLSYEEQLDFAHRQQCFIAPVVLPQPDRYATPFMQRVWLSFYLNIPSQFREERRLFIEASSQQFPELFSLPTDAFNGLPPGAPDWQKSLNSVYRRVKWKFIRTTSREHTNPNTNYVNFCSQFRSDTQLAKTAKRLIDRFDEQDIPVEVDANRIWNEHQSGTDLSKEIRLICSIGLFYETR